jgi:hypothetical protein
VGGQMQYIKHATKKISENIQQGIATLAHNDRLQDEALAAHKQNLDRLAELVASTKKNCSNYASAVTSMSGIGITMSSDIGQFYKSSDSVARSGFVGRFSDCAMRVDSLAIDVFRERFGWEILKRFDDWEEKIRKVDRQIQATEKNRVQVQNLSAQVSSLKGAKERRQQQGKELNEKEQFDEAEQKLEKYGRTLSKNRRQLDIDVGELMSDRFRELDGLLAKVVECQLEFFKNVAAAEADSLLGPLAAFKREFCSSDIPAAASVVTTKKPSPPSSDSEADDKGDTDSEEEAPLATVHVKDSEKKQVANGDLFHTAKAPSAGPKVVVSAPSPVKRQGTADDLLDMFTASKADAKPADKPKNAEPKPKPADQKSSKAPNDDLFNMFEADSLPTPTAKRPPASPSGSRSVSPAPPRTPASKPAPTFDNFDPYGSTATTTTKPTSRSPSPSPSPSPSKSTRLSSQASADPFSALNDIGSSSNGSSALEDYHQQEKNRATELAERDLARPKVDGKLAAWEFKSGTTKNNLRTLLATLHTILPESPLNRWKKMSLTDLLDVAQMKKGYRNAMLATHPDKWQNSPVADHKVIVQRCFEVLNDSWQAYQKEQGL